MTLEKDPSFLEDIIKEKLKTKGPDAYRMITYVEFLFSWHIQSLFHILNSKFIYTSGYPAYDRTKLYGILMYAYHRKVFTLTGVEYLCRNDEILKCFIGEGKPPTRNTFNNFLKYSNPVIFKMIFICTLVELNDLGFVDFRRIYCDSTDGKINGSVNYKVKLIDIECFKYMKKWGLLHNGTAHKMNKNRKKVEKLLKIYKNDEKILEYINHILKHFRLYDKNAYKRCNEIKEYLEEDPDGYVCVMFPEARFMKTKKGRFEFAMLIQQSMLKNGIILSGILQSQPNDSNSLEEILNDLKLTFDIWVFLQEIYGQRSNYEEIKNTLETTIMILDSGYFSDSNLESADKHNVNVLIMPRAIARRVNDKLRDKKFGDIDYIIEEELTKVTKRHADITSKGYLCPFGIHSEPCYEKPINSEYNRQIEGDNERYLEVSFNHPFICPPECPIENICTINPIEDRISRQKFDMIHKFTLKRYLKIYAERFGANEQIFGHFKGIIEIIKLFGSNKTTAQNHLYIMNTCYNLERKVSLKGTHI